MLQRTLCGLLTTAALTLPAFGQPKGGPQDRTDVPQPVLTDPDGRTLDRQTLVAAVLERNRELAAARRAVETARARAEEARGLPNLSASYGFAPQSTYESGVNFGQALEVGQELPWPGTLTRRGEQAEALADAAEGELQALRRELALAASQGFDDYWYVERALAINAEHLELLREFQEVAATRYAAGIGPQQAPLAAEVEIADREHDEVVLETDRRALIAILNALLHRPPDAELPPPPVDPQSIPNTEAAPAGKLIELALAQHPEVAAARARVGASETGVELARLAGRPDLKPTASFNSMWGTRAHRWMIGLGVSLPVWRDRVRAGVAAAQGDLAAERQELLALEDRIAAEVSTAADRLTETLHVLSLFRDRKLPSSRDQVRAAQSGFETGQVDFLAVIDAERKLRDIELGFADARAQAHRRLAALQQSVGALPGDPWPPTPLQSPRTQPDHAPPQPRHPDLTGAAARGRTP